MIPVENSAGGAASGSHQQAEGTPHQHANQITDIETYTNQKELMFSDDARSIQNTDRCDQCTPEKEHFVCRFRGGYNISAKGFIVDFLPNGLKTVGKQLLRSQRDFVFDGDDLQDHICHPNEPKQMEQGRHGEEIHVIEYIKLAGQA